MINIYVFGITQNKNAKTYMQREIHLFDYLKIKILMGMNILKPKKINIDIDIKKLIIRNCNGLVVPIQITIKDNVYVKRTIRNDK